MKRYAAMEISEDGGLGGNMPATTTQAETFFEFFRIMKSK